MSLATRLQRLERRIKPPYVPPPQDEAIDYDAYQRWFGEAVEQIPTLSDAEYQEVRAAAVAMSLAEDDQTEYDYAGFVGTFYDLLRGTHRAPVPNDAAPSDE